ncbi:CBS domain-containing protein [Saccharomonospora sp. NPDC006951]
MTHVSEIMTRDPHSVDTSDNVVSAARVMAAGGIGAVPVMGEDKRLKGMLTDRDIVVRVLAEGKDPMAVHAGEIVRGPVVTVRPDDDAADALRAMADHQVRRLPVSEDGAGLVGIVSQADVARVLPESDVGGVVGVISERNER